MSNTSGKTETTQQIPSIVAIDAETIPFDAEIDAVRQQYCAHSGRPLSMVPADVVRNIITIHGRETCIKILKTQQIKYSYDWIWLNENGLDNLAIHKPAEYFVYSFCKLMQDITVDDELCRLHQAAVAWQHLQHVDEIVLLPINELLRRLLANYKRSQINKWLREFTNYRVDTVAKSIDNLARLQIELTDLIQELIAIRKREEQIENGMSNFRAQRMITTLSKLELEVGRELNDFDIVSGKTSEVIHGITGTSYRHKHVKQDFRKFSDKIKYSTQPIKKKATGLKITLKLRDKS